MASSTAIVLHEREIDQPVDHQLQDVIDASTAQAALNFASTEDKVVLEVALGADKDAEDDDFTWLDDDESPCEISVSLDGASLEALDGKSLARKSTWFARALFASHASSFEDAATRSFCFRGNLHVSPTGMRIFLEWLANGAAALDVLSADEHVHALRVASYLEVPLLLRAIERRLVEAVDEENALPLLLLADEAGARGLFAAATDAALDALDRAALKPGAAGGGSAEPEGHGGGTLRVIGWAETPAAMRDYLNERRRLREAARRFGLADDALPDAREVTPCRGLLESGCSNALLSNVTLSDQQHAFYSDPRALPRIVRASARSVREHAARGDTPPTRARGRGGRVGRSQRDLAHGQAVSARRARRDLAEGRRRHLRARHGQAARSARGAARETRRRRAPPSKGCRDEHHR